MQAIREGADAVIAVGGDGTIHEVQTAFFSPVVLLLLLLLLLSNKFYVV